MKTEDTIDQASAKAKLKELQAEIDEAITNASFYFQRCEVANDYRYAQWDGQSDDGKKHEVDLGEEPFPWEGSSDTRVRLADGYINEDVMMLMAAVFRGKVQATAVKSTNAAAGNKVTLLIKWLINTHMLAELKREVELVAQWRQTFGLAFMGVFWEQETRMELRQLDLQALQATAMQQKNQQAMQLLNSVLDPLQEENLATMMQEMAPTLSMAEARKVVVDLRTTGAAEFPSPYIFKNKPRWIALRPFVDFFFPANTGDLQRARWVARREWFSETELRDKINTEEWNEAFVEEALKHKGEQSYQNVESQLLNESQGRPGFARLIEDYKDLVEILFVQYKAVDKGVPCVYETVMHYSVKELVAKHGLFEYEHGEYPYIPFVRERPEGTLLEGRGVAEMAGPWQDEIKTQRDFRTDRSSIAIMPPVKVPSNRGKMKLLFGPARQVSERRPGEIGWMTPPPFDGGTIEVEKASRMDADEYFGRLTSTMPAPRAQLHQQHLVDGFLLEFALAMKQTLKLMQQYMTDVEVARVVGTLAEPFHVNREEIQGEYDIDLTFDVRDLDTDYLMKKLEAIGKVVLPFDTAGVIDRAGLVEFAVGMIDPNLAERIVKPSGAVTQQEVNDEQVQFTKIAAGVEPPMTPGGQNYQLRMQVLENIVQSNPEIQARMKQDGIFARLLQNRMKHFQFMLEQQQNAQTGRVGAKPVLGPPGLAEGFSGKAFA